MIKIGVVVPTGEKSEVEVVRFFEAYGKKYLVYTLNEKDEQGFVKLYVARIDETADKALVGNFIDDDNEWKVVKDEFKKIIGENSDSGKTSANDLNPFDLANIDIKGNRVIKLMESYVNLLSANQKQFEQPAPAAPEAPAMDFGYQAPVMPEPTMPEAPAFAGVPPYSAPEAPAAPVADFGYSAPKAPVAPEPAPSYQAPVTPFPQMPEYPRTDSPMEPIAPEAPAASGNYEEMYNELKEKFDRCNAELEKVTNENIELRIKIDDIREILNEN